MEILNRISARGWIYIGLFSLGAALVLGGAVRIEDLGDFLLTLAVAAVTAGNLLARAFLEKPPPADDNPEAE